VVLDGLDKPHNTRALTTMLAIIASLHVVCEYAVWREREMHFAFASFAGLGH